MKILIVATDCQSGSAHYFSPKTSEEFFLQVRASAAVPYLHPKVLINGRKYAHGGLSDRLPVEKALADGYNEIVVVSNYSSREFVGRSWVDNAKVKIICSSVSSPLRWSFDSSEDRINQLVDLGISSAIGFIESQARR
ncbi:hypothetical protein HY061_00770 [Candidatus Azambacteria bacterium]|nr:hypothetical protein [Candidatus Azambacteria bacterium]